MSRTSTLILLGILVVLTPFSGLPVALRSFLAVIFGAGISGIGLALRTHEAQSKQQSMEVSPASAPTQPVAAEVSEPAPPQAISPI